jgi:ABC-type lipoprotein export system ATPase subunit
VKQSPTPGMLPLVRCHGVKVSLGKGRALTRALVDVDLTVEDGEAIVVWGRSGSGKSTLLHVLGGLVAPTAGTVEWPAGTRRVAHVFQSANLLPHFTLGENVAFAAYAARSAEGDGAAFDLQPLELLELVGLGSKAGSLPAEISGGEAQRVAIARALVSQPHLLLCDEPTGHLDSATADRVFALIGALQREFGFALVVATHDPDIAARLDREIELLDGRIVREENYS